MDQGTASGKVVLVEAHEGYRRTLQDLLRDALESRGIVTVASSTELLSALVAEPAPLCALVNHDLPEDGGRRAAQALWILAPGTPVIFFTNHAGAELDETSFPAPVALLCKPLRTWDIQSTLGKLRKRRPVMKPGPSLPFDP